ncbi:MAG: CmcI family methyltransferase [Thermomicrobiales bacterium]
MPLSQLPGAGEPSVLRAAAVDEFHQQYYDDRRRTWNNTYWMGHLVCKAVTDLWVYQELVTSIRPTAIIETGSAFGGSALFLASLCDLNGQGRVISVDVKPPPPVEHARITWLTGSSVAPGIVAAVQQFVHEQAEGQVMVILDSDHRYDHVLREMVAYAPLVTSGSYMIVEDTNINGRPVRPEFGPGPAEAVAAFLPDHPEFAVDPDCEKFLFTFNPGGYLRRA